MNSVSDAVAAGDRKEILLALRRTVAECIDDRPSPRDLAALVRAQLNIGRELAELDAGNGESIVQSLEELKDRATSKRKSMVLG